MFSESYVSILQSAPITNSPKASSATAATNGSHQPGEEDSEEEPGDAAEDDQQEEEEEGEDTTETNLAKLVARYSNEILGNIISLS